MGLDPNILVRVGGIYNLGFAVFHLFFWKLFRWEEDLASLTHINRAVMQILNLCLTFVFLLFGYLSLFHTQELLAGGLGKAILIGVAIFWFLRMIEQVIFFGLRNKVSVVFTIIFLFGSLLYILAIL
ncbi:MAG: hypothetical protein JW730_19040 [Anaerolineales bacterium]|nr:hypothetical protein [Anaerolineales bacterium]